MVTKDKIITPANVRRAHRRRLPAILKSINVKLRDGHRYFLAGNGRECDFPEGMYEMVVAKFVEAIPRGWEVASDPRYGTIRVRLPGEPKHLLP